VHGLWRGNHRIKNPASLKAGPGWQASLAELIKRPQAVANRRVSSISTQTLQGKFVTLVAIDVAAINIARRGRSLHNYGIYVRVLARLLL
jgi:hypothetical protein